MRRVSDAQIIKDNLFLVIFSVCTLIIGVFIPVQLFWPSSPVEYSDLIERDITIESFKLIHRGKGLESRYQIKGNDGEKYIIVGNFEYDIAYTEEKLSPGTPTSIKFFKNTLLFSEQNNVEEIFVAEDCLVSYSPADKPSIPAALVASALCIAVSAAVAKFVHLNIIRARQLQKKRDKRIAKKYAKAQRSDTD